MTAPSLPSARSACPDPPPGAGVVAKFFVAWNLTLLSALAIALCGSLWGQWRHNPDLSHGIFMPLICVLLFTESRRNGTRRYLRPGPASIAATGFLAAVALASLVAAGLFAVSLGWSANIVGFMLAAAFASILLAGVVGVFRCAAGHRFAGLVRLLRGGALAARGADASRHLFDPHFAPPDLGHRQRYFGAALPGGGGTSERQSDCARQDHGRGRGGCSGIRSLVHAFLPACFFRLFFCVVLGRGCCCWPLRRPWPLE